MIFQPVFTTTSRHLNTVFSGSMTYAPTTNAPARNTNVEAYINPNPNPNPNPYPALNQKPNHTSESNSVFGELAMPERLSPEHMSCFHRLQYSRGSKFMYYKGST